MLFRKRFILRFKYINIFIQCFKYPFNIKAFESDKSFSDFLQLFNNNLFCYLLFNNNGFFYFLIKLKQLFNICDRCSFMILITASFILIVGIFVQLLSFFDGLPSISIRFLMLLLDLLFFMADQILTILLRILSFFFGLIIRTFQNNLLKLFSFSNKLSWYQLDK